MISNVTNKIVPVIKEWQNRPLQGVYAVMFLDAIHFKVKQDGAIVNKAAYMVIGIDLEGNKGCARHVDRRERVREILAQCFKRPQEPRRTRHPHRLCWTT